MSTTDNHDQTKPCVSKPPARIELNANESAFDGRRIKKERTDVSLENGDGINAGINDTNKQLQSSHRPAAGRFSNGFHDDDLLQDIIAAKFTALANHGTTTKFDKIRLMIEDSIRLIQCSLSLPPLSLSFSLFSLLQYGARARAIHTPHTHTYARTHKISSLILYSLVSTFFFLFLFLFFITLDLIQFSSSQRLIILMFLLKFTIRFSKEIVC